MEWSGLFVCQTAVLLDRFFIIFFFIFRVEDADGCFILTDRYADDREAAVRSLLSYNFHYFRALIINGPTIKPLSGVDFVYLD